MMATFTLTIETDGAAFTDDEPEEGEAAGYGQPEMELARILRKLADRFDSIFIGSGGSGPVLDVYGNTCGKWSWGI